MKASLFLMFLLFSIPLFAQDETKNFDVRFGVGPTILGTGDMRTITLENELNFSINPYFTTALSANFGRSNRGVYGTASYIQGNLNIFLSPFKNTRRNDFRVGTGVSFNNVSDVRVLSSRSNSQGEVTEIEYGFDERSSYGYNIILEDTYTVKSKYLLGFKVFTQSFFSGDINSGVLLKIGVKI